MKIRSTLSRMGRFLVTLVIAFGLLPVILLLLPVCFGVFTLRFLNLCREDIDRRSTQGSSANPASV